MESVLKFENNSRESLDLKESINPYRFFLNKIKDGKINPADVRIDLLVESFKVQVELLNSYELYHQAAMFVYAISKILKLKTDKALEVLFPEDDTGSRQTRLRITAEEVEEALKEFDILTVDDLFSKFSEVDKDLSMFLNYTPQKAGGKAGGKGRRKPKTISFKRFVEEFKPFEKSPSVGEVLFKNTDYNEYAKQIYKMIRDGTFRIKTFQDFIGLMFAITIFNLEIDDIRVFLKKSKKCQ